MSAVTMPVSPVAASRAEAISTHNEEGRLARVCAVIVNYRTPALAIAAARSLPNAGFGREDAIVIVDNQSEDGSCEALESFAEDWMGPCPLKVVASPVNGGFSAGNNIGVAAQRAEWVLLLNSDAEARPGAIVSLLQAVTDDPAAGLVTPRIISPDGVEQVSRFRRHSILSEFLDGAQTGPLTRLFARAEVPIHEGDWSSAPDWVSFCAVMIRADVFGTIGPMDEGFFLYYEDGDYCRRAVEAGFTIVLAPGAEFQHAHGATTGLEGRIRRGERLPAYYYRSRNRFYRKVYGPMGPALANCAWLIGRAVAIGRSVIGRPAPRVPVGWASDIWIGWADPAA